MSDEPRRVSDRLLTRVRSRAWHPPGHEEPNLLFRLGVADYLSLVSLFFSWLAAVTLLSGEVNLGLLVTMVAVAFDKLDGFYARRFGECTALGRRIDSFIDVFAYLVSGALLYHVALSPGISASAVVGFVMLAFGGLRLIRFNEEGFQQEGDDSYYRGTTVVHTFLVVLGNYFLVALFDPWNGWLAGLTIVLVSPLMLSNVRSYKNDRTHALGALLLVAAATLAVALELGTL